MAEVIQFNCPVCGTLLRLPLAMASKRGPCPNCQREIMAPDPSRGIGAYEIPEAPPPREIEPFRPFADPLPEPVAVEEEEAPAPQVVQLPVCEKPQRAVLVLSCLLTAAVALALGFALGVCSKEFFMRVPTAAEQVRPNPPPAEVKAPEPIPVRVKTVIEEPPATEKPQEPATVAAAAEAALRAFLVAPDWASRSAYVLFPEKVRGAMEAYSREVPDGPTPFTAIAVKQTQIDEKSGHTLFIFFVSTEAFPTGIPVAVQETPGGWLVDWQSFVEFRDQLFQKFVDGPADKTRRFHLIVSPPPAERAANTENEHFVSYLLNAPLNQKPQIAFVKKASEVFETFQTATASGGFFTPVLEVAKRQTADGKNYLEVLGVPATDWLPRVD
ncbi:MAG: hypothetical protein RLZZ214_2697 [Verrucomicrobiota bacterium]